MRKLNAILIITAGVVFAASSQSALAGKSTGKSSTNLYKVRLRERITRTRKSQLEQQKQKAG